MQSRQADAASSPPLIERLPPASLGLETLALTHATRVTMGLHDGTTDSSLAKQWAPADRPVDCRRC